MGEALMDGAWADFVDWASREPNMLAAYEKHVGRPAFSKPANGLERLIDKATGHDARLAEDFMLWVTAWHWGWNEAPEKVLAALEKARAEGRLPLPTAEQVAAGEAEWEAMERDERQGVLRA